MSDTTNQTQPAAPPTTATAAKTPNTAPPTGTPANSNSSSSSSTVSSLAELKAVAPQVYNAMMQGIAMNVCNDMQKQQERLKELKQQYDDLA